jgi:hypothetical protein
MRKRILKREYEERGGMANSNLFRLADKHGRWFYYQSQADQAHDNPTGTALAMSIAYLQVALEKWRLGKSASNVLTEINSAKTQLEQAVGRLKIHRGD